MAVAGRGLRYVSGRWGGRGEVAGGSGPPHVHPKAGAPQDSESLHGSNGWKTACCSRRGGWVMLRFWSGAVLRLVAVMLMASFAGAMLMRIAPGFSSDDQELNSGLSAQSIQAIRQARLSDSNVPRFYAQYLASLVRGD